MHVETRRFKHLLKLPEASVIRIDPVMVVAVIAVFAANLVVVAAAFFRYNFVIVVFAVVVLVAVAVCKSDNSLDPWSHPLGLLCNFDKQDCHKNIKNLSA